MYMMVSLIVSQSDINAVVTRLLVRRILMRIAMIIGVIDNITTPRLRPNVTRRIPFTADVMNISMLKQLW